MTRDQKREMYSFILLALVGAALVLYTLGAWGVWAWDLVVAGDYTPDPFGLFEEDSPIVGWLLGL